MSFEHHTRIRFGQVDAAGVVYFSRHFEIAHEAYEELMSAIGLPIGEVFESGDWGMPLVHVEADYRRPWRLGEQVIVKVASLTLGTNSVEMHYRLVDEAGVERSEVKMRHAFVDLERFRARAVPESFRAGVIALGLAETSS